MFDDTHEATVFELNPLGARQRVIPNRRFKAVASAITELDPAQIIDEQVIATVRVPRLPPPPIPHIVRMNVRLTARLPPPVRPVLPALPASRLARILSRFALPIGGAIVMVLLSLYLALPGHAHNLSARITPLAIGNESPTETFQLTSTDDEPPAEELQITAKPTPQRHHRGHRRVIAVDSSTPLGNLRPH